MHSILDPKAPVMLFSNQIKPGDTIVGLKGKKFPVLRVEKGWVAEKFIVEVDGQEHAHDTSLQSFDRFKVIRGAGQHSKPA